MFFTLVSTVIGVGYNLWLYVRIFFGYITADSYIKKFGDITGT